MHRVKNIMFATLNMDLIIVVGIQNDPKFLLLSL
jgi:hypothetical protein